MDGTNVILGVVGNGQRCQFNTSRTAFQCEVNNSVGNPELTGLTTLFFARGADVPEDGQFIIAGGPIDTEKERTVYVEQWFRIG